MTTNDPLAQPTLFELPPAVLPLSLADRFVVPPFSVLDGRGGQWQERKRQWLELGIDSGAGRDDKLLDYHSITQAEHKPCPTCDGTGTIHPGGIPKPCRQCKGTGRKFSGFGTLGSTSLFDPVLCELVYRWFCPPGGHVLDPFAGGSVRGLVAGFLGRRYVGIDLRPEQVQANIDQAVIMAGRENVVRPQWVAGDSRRLHEIVQGQYDLVFSCPPYYDLEKYSNDPDDLSNAADYAKFLDGYGGIIGQACARLASDRFAAWVVGEIRAPTGWYRGLVPDTIRLFKDAGCAFYNEFILCTPLGTAPVRAAAQFGSGRKAVKCHQQLLVFVKGDPQAAAAACPLEGVGADDQAGEWLSAEQAAAQR